MTHQEILQKYYSPGTLVSFAPNLFNTSFITSFHDYADVIQAKSLGMIIAYTQYTRCDVMYVLNDVCKLKNVNVLILNRL